MRGRFERFVGQGHGDKTRQERELTFNIKRMLGTVLSTLQTPDTIALTIGNEIIDYYPILKMWKLRLRMMVFPRSQGLGILCAQICAVFFRSNNSLYAHNYPMKRKLRLREVRQPARGCPGLQGLGLCLES